MEKLRFGPIVVKNRLALKVFGWADERLAVKEFLDDEVFTKLAPTHLGFFSCFGGITFFLFLMEILTGLLLMVYYIPDTQAAYKSVVAITNDIPFGWAVRGMHFWGANLMILTVMIHMGKIYFGGIYKPPRELNWITGVLLLLLTLGFGFTGYLLPWTQLSYWATVVGTETPAAMPLVGEWIKILMRGGDEITQVTLSRFFMLHVIVLPVITVLLLAAHFAQIRRQGISGPM
jgi:menaquinol-cytochrome c reductase cytochrome b subunit